MCNETASSLIEKNIYRVGSEKYFEYFRERREWFNYGLMDELSDFDKGLMEGSIGEFAEFEGEMVPLECPMYESLDEAEYKGEKVQLNKPKRGGAKKFYVYVKNDKGNVIKVSFGDTTGLKAKISDPEARKNFADRHNCAEKKDKTKAGYWSCNLPRYAKQLGLSGGGNFFW